MVVTLVKGYRPGNDLQIIDHLYGRTGRGGSHGDAPGGLHGQGQTWSADSIHRRPERGRGKLGAVEAQLSGRLHGDEQLRGWLASGALAGVEALIAWDEACAALRRGLPACEVHA